MDFPIKNINDLRSEIYRLQELEVLQSSALRERFKGPSAIFSSIKSLFHTTNVSGSKSSSFFDQDIVSLISRFILPFTLNKTLFRNSGFIIKTLVGMVSQKASNFITEDSIAGVWDKVKAIFHSKTQHDTPLHKGVPPLSETY